MPELKSDALINADFIIREFRLLPDVHRRAIAWYMAFDGDAWADALDTDEVFEEAADLNSTFFQRVDALFGDVEFGYGLVSTDDMVSLIKTDSPVVDVGEEKFFRGFIQHPKQKLDERYPVIFSDCALGDEYSTTLTDGWTRMVTYVNHGYDLIPAVFFPTEHHYELLEKLKANAAACKP
jgi:hypothetical protein